MNPSQRVVIGMGPAQTLGHLEVMTSDETVLGGGRFGTDHAGIATSSCARPS